MWFTLPDWLRILLNDSGQIPATLTDGTADDGGDDDPGSDGTQDTAEPTGTGATTGDAAPAGTEESFIDLKDLPPELKPHWKRMHGAYTKKMQTFKATSDKAALVDRFNTDPSFALQTLQQVATQHGYQLVKPGQTLAPVQATPSPGGTPQAIVEAVQAKLAPEIQWMAPALAAAVQTGMQLALKPEREAAATRDRQTRQEAYSELADELTGAAPGWEQHEDDMEHLLAFLQSDRLTDKRWGSKLQLLYNLATANAEAVNTATQRMSAAGRNRIRAGGTSRTVTDNYQERIQKAQTQQQKFAIAAEQAVAELQRQGVPVPA